MSVAVCRGPSVVPAFEAPVWLRPVEPYKQQPEVVAVDVDDRPAQVDIWNAIQADVVQDDKKQVAPAKKPYVQRSSSRRLMSQKSLEVCTESLGNETGSGDFTSSLDMASLFDSPPSSPLPEPFWQQLDADRCCADGEEEKEEQEEQWEKKDLAAVNYHCFSSGRTTRSSQSQRRSFPPPLPSMSRRDGPCLQMRPRRHDGRLVLEAVAVRPRGYLHATRQGGRLRLSFVECSSSRDQSASKIAAAAAMAEAPYFRAVEEPRKNVQEEEAAAEAVKTEEEEEEEVEVVDRGTVVEVKVVTTQPQTAAAAKVHRSTLVINKFVGSTPVCVAASADQHHQPRGWCDAAADDTTAAKHGEVDPEINCDDGDDETAPAQSPRPSPTLRRVPSSTTSLAAAVAVASTVGTGGVAPAAAPEEEEEEDDDECGGLHRSGSTFAAAETSKQLLLFTSRRGDRQDLLQSVRRCRQLRQKKLFILEPYCIATS